MIAVKICSRLLLPQLESDSHLYELITIVSSCYIQTVAGPKLRVTYTPFPLQMAAIKLIHSSMVSC